MYEVESHERETFDFEAGGQEFHVTKYRCLPLDVAMRMGIAQRDRDGMAVTQTICELSDGHEPRASRCLGLKAMSLVNHPMSNRWQNFSVSSNGSKQQRVLCSWSS